MNMKLINLTPHDLTLRGPDGSDVIVPSSGVARVRTTPGELVEVPGIPVPIALPTLWGEIEGLPAPQADTIVVVSALVAERARRSDVVSPGTGPADGAIRDADGRIVAVTRLIRWA